MEWVVALFIWAYSGPVLIALSVVGAVGGIIFWHLFLHGNYGELGESFTAFVLYILGIIVSAFGVPFLWLPVLIIGLLFGSIWLFWRHLIKDSHDHAG